jgi:hypothetical protein
MASNELTIRIDGESVILIEKAIFELKQIRSKLDEFFPDSYDSESLDAVLREIVADLSRVRFTA